MPRYWVHITQNYKVMCQRRMYYRSSIIPRLLFVNSLDPVCLTATSSYSTIRAWLATGANLNSDTYTTCYMHWYMKTID